MLGGGPVQYVITLDDGLDNMTFYNDNTNDVQLIELCVGGQF